MIKKVYQQRVQPGEKVLYNIYFKRCINIKYDWDSSSSQKSGGH